jgi:hypothetical protein
VRAPAKAAQSPETSPLIPIPCLTRTQAEHLLDLALAARDEARQGVEDRAWLSLVAAVYGLSA